MNKNLQSLEWLTLKEVKDRRKTIASHYDYYTDYIDSWKQQQEALANNKRISEEFCGQSGCVVSRPRSFIHRSYY